MNLNSKILFCVLRAIFSLSADIKRNKLGFLWWILEPLLYFSIYYIVFGILLGSGGENYALSLLIAIVPWMLGAKILIGCLSSIEENKDTLLELPINPIIYPFSYCFEAIIKEFPMYLFLLLFLYLEGFWNIQILVALPLIIFHCFIFSGIGFIVGWLACLYNDIKLVIPPLITVGMFLSGVFYDADNVNIAYREYFLLNPIANLNEQLRDVILEGSSLRIDLCIQYTSLIILFGIICCYAYRKKGRSKLIRSIIS